MYPSPFGPPKPKFFFPGLPRFPRVVFSFGSGLPPWSLGQDRNVSISFLGFQSLDFFFLGFQDSQELFFSFGSGLPPWSLGQDRNVSISFWASEAQIFFFLGVQDSQELSFPLAQDCLPGL